MAHLRRPDLVIPQSLLRPAAICAGMAAMAGLWLYFYFSGTAAFARTSPFIAFMVGFDLPACLYMGYLASVRKPLIEIANGEVRLRSPALPWRETAFSVEEIAKVTSDSRHDGALEYVIFEFEADIPDAVPRGWRTRDGKKVRIDATTSPYQAEACAEMIRKVIALPKALHIRSMT